MSTIFRHIPHALLIPAVAEVDLPAYAVAVQGTAVNGAVLPAGAEPATGFRGITTTRASAGQSVDLAGEGCILPVKTSAAVAKGAQLTPADAAGRVHTVPALAALGTGVHALVIGEALEAATGADQLVAMLVRVYRVTGT